MPHVRDLRPQRPQAYRSPRRACGSTGAAGAYPFVNAWHTRLRGNSSVVIPSSVAHTLAEFTMPSRYSTSALYPRRCEAQELCVHWAVSVLSTLLRSDTDTMCAGLPVRRRPQRYRRPLHPWRRKPLRCT
jgi:hypothetical protein